MGGEGYVLTPLHEVVTRRFDVDVDSGSDVTTPDTRPRVAHTVVGDSVTSVDIPLRVWSRPSVSTVHHRPVGIGSVNHLHVGTCP